MKQTKVSEVKQEFVPERVDLEEVIPGLLEPPLTSSISIRGMRFRGESVGPPMDLRNGDIYNDIELGETVAYVERIYDGTGVDDWQPNNIYFEGDHVVESNILYVANADFTSGASFNASSRTREAIVRRTVTDNKSFGQLTAGSQIIPGPDVPTAKTGFSGSVRGVLQGSGGFTIVKDGRYHINVFSDWDPTDLSDADKLTMRLAVNGSTVQSDRFHINQTSGILYEPENKMTHYIDLVQGDTIGIAVEHTGNTPITIISVTLQLTQV